jgi:hypothetical protein
VRRRPFRGRRRQDGLHLAALILGTLIQFWNHFEPEPSHPAIATHRHGGEPVRVRVNHMAIAVRDLAAGLGFFERFFGPARSPDASATIRAFTSPISTSGTTRSS